jgi:hypothetical protein
MINGFTDAQTIGALIAVLVASYAAFFGWLVTSISALRRDMHALNRETRQELGARIDTLDAKLSAVDARLSAKLDLLTIAVSRLEGAVYHGLPEPRRAAE